MQANIEIDQSSKVEDTSADTVLAFSDHIGWAILVSAGVKRAALSALRKRWRGRRGRKPAYYDRLFAVALFLLIKDHLDKLNVITIDVEYPEREAGIKGTLLRLIRTTRPDFANERIVFRRIGKKSTAHKLALATYRGERLPDHIVTITELLTWL